MKSAPGVPKLGADQVSRATVTASASARCTARIKPISKITFEATGTSAAGWSLATEDRAGLGMATSLDGHQGETAAHKNSRRSGTGGYRNSVGFSSPGRADLLHHVEVVDQQLDGRFRAVAVGSHERKGLIEIGEGMREGCLRANDVPRLVAQGDPIEWRPRPNGVSAHCISRLTAGWTAVHGR